MLTIPHDVVLGILNFNTGANMDIMQQSLSGLEMVPEYTSGIVYHMKSGVLAHHLSPGSSPLTEDKLAEFCRSFTKVWLNGRMKFGDDTSGVSCVYENSACILRKVREDVFLVAAFAATAELSVVSLAVDTCLHELRQADFDAAAPAAAPASQPASAPVQSGPSPQDYERFKAMMSTLLSHVVDLAGPIGEMLCEDAIESVSDADRLPKNFPAVFESICEDLEPNVVVSLKARLQADNIRV